MLHKTVGELCQSLTAREFATWQAYLQLEPPGEKDDFRMAVTCATVAQCNGNKVTYKDFLPRKPQTIEEQIAIMKAVG